MVRRTIFRIMKLNFIAIGNAVIDLSEWKPEYSVGNATLDAQHKKLLQICKSVSQYQCDGSKTSTEAFHSILSELAFYADRHFELEEDVLRRIGFPDLQQQIQEHNTYREWLAEFLFSTIYGNIDKPSLQSYLEQWWVSHILDSDMQYTPII